MNRPILLIEDNPISREFLYEALLPLSIQVHVADTLAAAILLVRQYQYSLFLCDVHLPDGGPADIYHALEPNLDSAKIVAITAEASPAASQELLDIGYEAVWGKPIAMSVLQNNIARLLDIDILDTTCDSEIELWDEAGALRAVGNNQATLSALRNMFLAELPQQTRLIAQAFENSDSTRLRAECHKLLAGCGFVGAAGLRLAVKELSENPDCIEKKRLVIQQAEKYLA
ncbi:MAG: response regulator [Arenimonas sp.]